MLRHWDRARAGWVGAEIKSDVDKKQSDGDDEMGLDDLFGF